MAMVASLLRLVGGRVMSTETVAAERLMLIAALHTDSTHEFEGPARTCGRCRVDAERLLRFGVLQDIKHAHGYALAAALDAVGHKRAAHIARDLSPSP